VILAVLLVCDAGFGCAFFTLQLLFSPLIRLFFVVFVVLLLQEMVQDHQDKRALVTPEIIQQYMAVRELEF